MGLGIDFLSLQNNIWGNYSLSIGAVMLCVFVGWTWGIPKAIESLEASGHKCSGSGLWGILVRYVCPIANAIVLGYIIWTGQYF